MGKCLVTKLDSVIDNPNLPVLLPDGRAVDVMVGQMYYKMAEFSYTPSATEINAAQTFIEDGKYNGWINYIKYFIPFIGDKTHYLAACVPLIDKLYDYQVLDNPIPTANPSLAFVYDANDKIMSLGNTNGSTLERSMALPIKQSDMSQGFTIISTVKLDNPSNWKGDKTLYSFVNGSGDGVFNTLLRKTGTNVSCVTRNVIADLSNPKQAGVLVFTTSDYGEMNLAGSCFTDVTIGENKADYYKIFIPKGAQGVIQKSSLNTPGTVVPVTEDTGTFKIGVQADSSHLNVAFRSMSVFDPAISSEQVRAYSNAVFTLNTALGRYSE